ncbi:MAG: hypothetical protein P1P87_04135 [Trueperaceae bacterium]|nr:hypothetical protein [Trueperaceae bacterium]
MVRYVFGRILIGIPILFLVITLVFFAFRLIPGDAARIIAGDEAPIERVEQIRRDLGLDRPAIVQYGAYLAGRRAATSGRRSPRDARSPPRSPAATGTPSASPSPRSPWRPWSASRWG